MQLNGWDRALKVTADGQGLVGHAGAILLRKAADQLGLTAGLSAALLKKGTSPLLDRGTVLASLAVAIALGATSMSDIALLAHLSPVLGAAPGGPTVRRALDLAGTPRMLDRVARARAKAREHAWNLIERTPAGFPWLAVAGKTLTGWLVIDMDATLVTSENLRLRQEALRLACADFTTAVARMWNLAVELMAKPADIELANSFHEAHREARMHYERLRLTAAPGPPASRPS